MYFFYYLDVIYVCTFSALEHWISSFYTLFVSFIESESSVFPKTEYFCVLVQHMHSFPGGSVIKHLTANAGNTDSIPGSGRSPGEGNGSTSSIFTWEITWTEEPGELQFTSRKRVRHNLQLNSNNKYIDIIHMDYTYLFHFVFFFMVIKI